MEASECRFVVNRPAHSEVNLQKQLGISIEGDNVKFLERLREKASKACRCSGGDVLSFISRLFPFFSSLRNYQKEWIYGDIAAGLSVGVVHIPQSLAFAILAGVAPIFGLYSSFYPLLIYTLMGTSRHISVGTFVVTSLLTRSVVYRYFPPEGMPLSRNNTFMTNATIAPELNETASDMDIKRAEVAAALAFVMGIFQLLFGIFRLGFLTAYLSEPMIQGFTTGAACQAVTSQIPSILGLNIKPYDGPFAMIFSWIDILKNLPSSHVPTTVIATLCMCFLVLGREINIRYKDHMKTPIPSEVIVVIIAILAAHFGNFESRYSVNVISNIPVGLPSPKLPALYLLGDIVADGFIIAVVGFTFSVSLSKMYGIKHGYSIDASQELVAYGASNFISSFFCCFPGAVSLTRSEIQSNTGGKTQVVGVVSLVIILTAVLALGPVFEPLPKTVLGCIIVVGLFGILSQFGNLKNFYKTAKTDFVVWIVTCLAVMVLGVEFGLLAGIIFSIMTVIVRTQRPRFDVLYNIANTEIYRAKGSHVQENELAGVVVVKLYASLYYVNKDLFEYKLAKAIGFNPDEVAIQLKKERDAEEKRKHSSSIVTYFNSKRKKLSRRQSQMPLETNGRASVSSVSSVSVDVSTSWKSDVHTLIVDCGCFGFLDFVGGKTLTKLCNQYNELGISFLLANCNVDVQKQLIRSGYFEVSGENSIFVSIHDAMLHSLHKRSH